jgi:hypothetical protein
MSYFLEFTGGVHEGHRFDVDSSSGADNLVALNLTSPRNTMTTLPAGLAGSSFVLREHMVIEDVFAKDLFKGSTIISAADQLQFYINNGQGSQNFTTYFLLDARPQNPAYYWRAAAGSGADAGQRILPPGQGVLVHRVGGSAPTVIQVQGYVRANAFIQPLPSGFSLAAEPHPLDRTPVSRAALPPVNGFAASTDIALADQIQVFDGTRFTTYFLLAHPVQGPVWRMVGGSSEVQNDNVIFRCDGALLIKKRTTDPNYRVPPPWTP